MSTESQLADWKAMGHDLTTEQADELAKFIINCGIAERTEARNTSE